MKRILAQTKMESCISTLCVCKTAPALTEQCNKRDGPRLERPVVGGGGRPRVLEQDTELRTAGTWPVSFHLQFVNGLSAPCSSPDGLSVVLSIASELNVAWGKKWWSAPLTVDLWTKWRNVSSLKYLSTKEPFKE